MTLIDCKFVRFRKLKVEKVRKNDAFWRFSKQLDNIWQNQLKCPLLLLLRHFWCCHYYHPSLLLSLSYNPPSEISHVEKCIHLHSSGTIQVFNRVNIKDLPPDLSPTLAGSGVCKKVTKIEIHQDMYQCQGATFFTEYVKTFIHNSTEPWIDYGPKIQI